MTDRPNEMPIVGLKGFERRSIYQLNGGQQQFVAIALSTSPAPERVWNVAFGLRLKKSAEDDHPPEGARDARDRRPEGL